MKGRLQRQKLYFQIRRTCRRTGNQLLRHPTGATAAAVISRQKGWYNGHLTFFGKVGATVNTTCVGTVQASQNILTDFVVRIFDILILSGDIRPQKLPTEYCKFPTRGKTSQNFMARSFIDMLL